MSRLTSWIGLGAILLLGAIVLGYRAARLRFTPLHAHALPGFDLDLPDGNVEREDKGYGSGQMHINGLAGGRSFMRVTWEPGGLYEDEDIDRMNKALGSMLHEEVRPIPIAEEVAVPRPYAARSWAAHLGPTTSWVTQAVCGARRVTFLIMGSQRGIEHLHRRIAASFRCHPDAAKEQTAGEVPVAFDVGAGWFHAPSSGGDLQITDGQFVLIARPIAGAALPSDVREFVGAALPGFRFKANVGDDWSFDMDGDGETTHGWLTLRACGEAGQLLVLSMFDGEGDKQARALLHRARCRKPGEAPQHWPEMPDEDGAK